MDMTKKKSKPTHTATFTHTYYRPGRYFPKITVRDTHGKIVEASLPEITVIPRNEAEIRRENNMLRAKINVASDVKTIEELLRKSEGLAEIAPDDFKDFAVEEYGKTVDKAKKCIDALNMVIQKKRVGVSVSPNIITQNEQTEQWDVFICYATEDKESVVEPIARALRESKISVWYDEFELKVGDSLRRSIDKGISRSHFGVVVLSNNFFAKEWPQKELDGLVAIGSRILPVWHKIEKEEVAKYSPILADLIAAKTSKGIPVVIEELTRVIKPTDL